MKRREFTEEFRREAVRLVETSGLTLKQVAEDLGIGLSTLTRWKQIYRSDEGPPDPDADQSKELSRLRKENDLLRKERDLLKKVTAFFAKETNPLSTVKPPAGQ